MKKALIYDPYLDTLGGGERYCLTVAECLLKSGWQVDLFWERKEDIKKAISRFNLELRGLDIVGERPERLSFTSRVKLERKYDLIFWLSDGSIPFLFGKNNILHFQVPFTSENLPSTLLTRCIDTFKKKLISRVVCNSRFTKRIIDKTYKVDSIVLYPPVDVERFKPGKKENIILAVGRFEETMQAKRQDVLVEAFKRMVDEGLKNWQLVLIGGSLQEERRNRFLNKLKREVRGYPIEFIVNAPFSVLQNYYSRAKIFWHAAGFGVDEEKEPHRVEHFGITTVEAMAAGCVPVVIDKGGLREIVRRGMGERWKEIKELIKKTFELVNDEDLLERYSLKAKEQSLKFSKEKFLRRLLRMLDVHS
jgi:glycosyltransferase involved in cell wall biosynthesis